MESLKRSVSWRGALCYGDGGNVLKGEVSYHGHTQLCHGSDQDTLQSHQKHFDDEFESPHPSPLPSSSSSPAPPSSSAMQQSAR